MSSLNLSALESLKIQIEHMNKRINDIENDLNRRKNNINTLQIEKNKLEETLLIENSEYDKLFQNFEYLKEVRTNTTENYNQIEESANTLLDILKNKCDGI
jgi:chromosome segregation ATPase